MRKTVCMDFDGVIHSYSSGWKGPCEIPDPPVKGAFEWIVQAITSEKFIIAIYSSRSKEPGAILAMKQWFARWGLPNSILESLQFPTNKPVAHVYIDDRAYCFEGTWPALEVIENFVPWYRR